MKHFGTRLSIFTCSIILQNTFTSQVISAECHYTDATSFALGKILASEYGVTTD